MLGALSAIAEYSIIEVIIILVAIGVFTFILLKAITGKSSIHEMSDYFHHRRHLQESMSVRQDEIACELTKSHDAAFRAMTDSIDKMRESQERMETKQDDLSEKVKLLMASDKDDIKSYIMEKHRECKARGSITDQEFEILLKRFKHYEDEGGNTYVSLLMDELAQLHRVSTPIYEKYVSQGGDH